MLKEFKTKVDTRYLIDLYLRIDFSNLMFFARNEIEKQWSTKKFFAYLYLYWFNEGNNYFCWSGEEEAASAGKALKQGCYKFDVAHTSVLKRAQNTLGAILKELGQEDIPISRTWRLNERHYGGLTGLNKAETAAKYGEEQVIIINISLICSCINLIGITLLLNKLNLFSGSNMET